MTGDRPLTMIPFGPTDEEIDLRVRGRLLLEAGRDETEATDLRLALLTQSERIGMKAVALELERKQSRLRSIGIPTKA